MKGHFKLHLMIGFVLLSALVVLAAAASYGRDIKGEFAQYSPKQQKWLSDRLIPGGDYKGTRCCGVADGTQAEEKTQGDQYIVTFEACFLPGNYLPPICRIKGPMLVPHEVVLDGPNEVGVPVVWYGWVNWDGKDGDIVIKCFAPGPGI